MLVTDVRYPPWMVSLNSKFSCSKSKLKKRFEKWLLFSSCKCMPSDLPFSVVPLHRVQIVIFFLSLINLIYYYLSYLFKSHVFFFSTQPIYLLILITLNYYSLSASFVFLLVFITLFVFFSLFASFVYSSLCLYCQYSILFIEMNSALLTLNYIYMLYAINICNNSNLQFYCIIFKNCLCFFLHNLSILIVYFY